LGTRVFAYGQLGRAYIAVGSYVEAVTSLERSREIARASHIAFEMEPTATAVLAKAYAYVGETDRALRTAEETLEGARQRSVGPVPYVLLELARVLLRTNGLDPVVRSRQLLRKHPNSRGKRSSRSSDLSFALRGPSWRGLAAMKPPANGSSTTRVGSSSRLVRRSARRRSRRRSVVKHVSRACVHRRPAWRSFEGEE
jgi:tetratricopeptide (TPR) repeat protein